MWKCKCGCDEFEELNQGVTVISECWVSGGEVRYGKQTNYDGGDIRYQCVNCGEVIEGATDHDSLLEITEKIEETVIKLPCFGIEVFLTGDGGGSIEDELQEVIDYENESEEEVSEKQKYNDMVDALTSLILAHACAGIDIKTPAYIEGIETAVENIGNMF